MNLREIEQEAVVVLSLEGDVVGGPEAQAINERLRELAEAGKKQVVLDVAEVGVVNSSGLGLLIAGLTVMRNAGGDLRLARPSSKLKKLLEVTKLSQVFTVYDSVDEAVSSYAAA